VALTLLQMMDMLPAMRKFLVHRDQSVATSQSVILLTKFTYNGRAD